jgi:U3 small nucleolar RNA-associated protein 3
MYFSLLTSPAAEGAQDVTAISASRIRDHPVMESLISCRDLWTNVATLPEEDLEQMSETSDDEASEISADEKETDSVSQAAIKQPKTRESRAERHAQASRAAAEQRTAERIRRAEASSAGLDALVTLSAKPKSHNVSRTRRASIEDSDFGDEAPLTAKEAAEKAQKKKSLRFYTSQITQKANKRGTAGRNAGGDDDIPHRERLKDRQARLNAEAEKRGQRTGAGDGVGADLGDDSDEDDRRQARELRADADEDDYYDLVAARTAKKKESKAALAEAQRQAALHGGQVVPEEVVGTDGKRKISYLIEKNKGLTPHRKKDVRNPRVKKRKKYDEKKKKLASIKPVYKGGEGRGGYGGELTGIKKGLVKSQKLS